MRRRGRRLGLREVHPYEPDRRFPPAPVRPSAPGRAGHGDSGSAPVPARPGRRPPEHAALQRPIRENITYGLPGVTDAEIWRAVEIANCAEFIQALPKGLDSPLGAHGGRLSGGQKQRISIARALLRDPQVIIFDEATSALDVASERLVQEAIARMVKGRTTFIVAHRFSTIRIATRIVVLKDGRCVECGPAEELLARDGEFRRLHRLQS